MTIFRQMRTILFDFRAKDLLNHVDGFSLAFMVNPYQHLSQQPHADELDADNYQEGPEQEERPAADITAHKEFIQT